MMGRDCKIEGDHARQRRQRPRGDHVNLGEVFPNFSLVLYETWTVVGIRIVVVSFGDCMCDREHVLIVPRGDGGGEELDCAKALAAEVNVLKGGKYQYISLEKSGGDNPLGRALD